MSEMMHVSDYRLDYMLSYIIERSTIEQYVEEAFANAWSFVEPPREVEEGLGIADCERVIDFYTRDMINRWYSEAWDLVKDDCQNVVDETKDAIYVDFAENVFLSSMENTIDILIDDGEYTEVEGAFLARAADYLVSQQLKKEIDPEIVSAIHVFKIPKTRQFRMGGEHVQSQLDDLVAVMSPAEAVDFLTVRVRGERSASEQAEVRGVSRQAVSQNLRDAEEKVARAQLLGYRCF